MKLIKAFIQPHKLTDVTLALHGVSGITGMTVSDVRGWGRGRHRDLKDHPDKFVGDFEKHCKVEIVCKADLAPGIVTTIRDTAHTGLRGDGLIIVLSVEDAVRISTGEKGKEIF